MRRRRNQRRDDGEPARERWMVSYADFITLLFALFVVMYAISTLSEGKYRVLSESIRGVFRHEPVSSVAMPPIVPIPQIPIRARPPQPKPLIQDARLQQEEKLKGLANQIGNAIDPLMKSGQVQMRETVRGLAVEINASVLFAPGQAVLQPGSVAALEQVVEVLRSVENSIEVEGHTDKQPIATSQYHSNWELSSARASAVIRLFVATGLPAERLVAVGYADNRPIQLGDSPDALARNRRVTLLILSDAAKAAVGNSLPEAKVAAAKAAMPASPDAIAR